MSEGIEQTVASLANRKAGWVTRRDAADSLATLARTALTALHAHQDDPDVDVRAAVLKALDRLNAPLAPGEIAAGASTLEELARACAKPKYRVVSPWENGYAIRVSLRDGRTQTVYLVPCERDDGRSLVRVFTYCGEVKTEILEWALRNNERLAHCAFAIDRDKDKERIILVNNLYQDRATAEAVKSAVKEIAHFGDWVEKRLSGGDTL